MKRFLSIFILMIGLGGVSGQYIDNFTYGIKAGGLHSRITNLPEMIIGRDYDRVQFEMENVGVYGVEGGVFVNYKIPDSRVALQPELLYRKSGAKVNYYNETIDRSYTLSFDYSYLVLGTSIKLYPLQGTNIGIGVFYSKNLTPNSLEYTSNEFDGRYDTNYGQFYREGIVGKDDFNLSFSLGYEFAESLNIEARYYLGVGDMIGNRVTSFQFLENTNRNSILSLSIGYNFSNWQ